MQQVFDQWLFKPGHPVLEISYDWDEQKEVVSLTVKQTQDVSNGTAIFRLPIKIGITTKAGRTVESVWLNSAEETYRFDAEEKPLMVRFDEGDVLLKEWTFNKPVDELIYQLENDSVMGRLWAIAELPESIRLAVVRTALSQAGENDPSLKVREAATKVMGDPKYPKVTRHTNLKGT